MTTPPTPLTDEQLDQLDKLCKEATEGPWGTAIYRNRWCVGLAAGGHGSTIAEFTQGLPHDFNAKANALLFTASRTAVPALIAEVRRLGDDSTLNIGNDNQRDSRSQRQQYKDSIASLEVQLVTIREALEAIQGTVVIGPTLHNRFITALSTTTDYANKVVVDREEWEALNVIAANCDFNAICAAEDRLDSLRQGDGE